MPINPRTLKIKKGISPVSGTSSRLSDANTQIRNAIPEANNVRQRNFLIVPEMEIIEQQKETNRLLRELLKIMKER